MFENQTPEDPYFYAIRHVNYIQGLFKKLKAVSSRDKKGHFFHMKNYKRTPHTWATPMFIAYLQYFFFAKKSQINAQWNPDIFWMLQ